MQGRRNGIWSVWISTERICGGSCVHLHCPVECCLEGGVVKWCHPQMWGLVGEDWWQEEHSQHLFRTHGREFGNTQEYWRGEGRGRRCWSTLVRKIGDPELPTSENHFQPLTDVCWKRMNCSGDQVPKGRCENHGWACSKLNYLEQKNIWTGLEQTLFPELLGWRIAIIIIVMRTLKSILLLRTHLLCVLHLVLNCVEIVSLTMTLFFLLCFFACFIKM